MSGFFNGIIYDMILERKYMKEKSRNIKICFAASSGGHYEQLLMLEPLMNKYTSFILTEKTKYSILAKNKKTYYVEQINRKEKLFYPKLLLNTITSLLIFCKENPDVIVCTGALAVIPICLIGKLFRKKLIYIESYAKVTSATKSGELLYNYADQFYVQWEDMLEIFPNAIYLGGIY